MQEEIITLLKKKQGYLSGEEISRAFNISRAAIWKCMQTLRRQGYKIEASPHLGYRFLSSPDKLLPWEIRFDLKTKRIGKNIIIRQAVSSTMDEAFEQANRGAEEGTVVCAESQTKGRGRMGRSWVSPKGKGIYLSVILRPQLAPSQAAQLTLMTAVAVCEALQKVSGVDVRIKWPNDLLVKNRKVSGILTEMSAEVDRIKFIVVGIGINVNASKDDLPPSATSLKVEAKKNFPRVPVIQEILRSLEKWYDPLPTAGFEPVLRRWKELSMTLGKRVKISELNGSVEGEAVDLANDGGLLIRNISGVIVKKMSGDVAIL